MLISRSTLISQYMWIILFKNWLKRECKFLFKFHMKLKYRSLLKCQSKYLFILTDQSSMMNGLTVFRALKTNSEILEIKINIWNQKIIILKWIMNLCNLPFNKSILIWKLYNSIINKKIDKFSTFSETLQIIHLFVAVLMRHLLQKIIVSVPIIYWEILQVKLALIIMILQILNIRDFTLEWSINHLIVFLIIYTII